MKHTQSASQALRMLTAPGYTGVTQDVKGVPLTRVYKKESSRQRGGQVDPKACE